MQAYGQHDNGYKSLNIVAGKNQLSATNFKRKGISKNQSIDIIN
jgi:hypothetical protein